MFVRVHSTNYLWLLQHLILAKSVASVHRFARQVLDSGVRF